MKSIRLLGMLTLSLVLFSELAFGQTLSDDFEGNGNISTWFGDACQINIQKSNPFTNGTNSSATVLEYDDQGGQYANLRFDAGYDFDLSRNAIFSLMVYVPSSGITGNSPNQISLKLQDGNIGAPWSTQTEIIKPLVLDQWQMISFDFANDPYINLSPMSPSPLQRADLNRVLIQINGENNSNQVKAYLDNFYYFDSIPPPPVFNQLVWSDEFNQGGALDPNKWFHQTQLPLGGSWYNGEIQHYTNRNANSYMANGNLNLVAKKETFTDQGHTKQYISARLNSKFAFQYGRVEVRAKLPTGIGTWPAIWMLGQDIIETGAYWTLQGFGAQFWPACGEIDIMEHWGNNQNFVQSAMHTPSSHGGTVNHGGQVIPTTSSAFHVYELEWSKDKMVFSVDGVVHYTYNPSVKDASTWPFDAPQYLLLNIAIQPSISPSFTQSSIEVDYVRVYQESTVGIEKQSSHERFELFPNPVNNELFLKAPFALGEKVHLQIYSLDGKLQLERIETGKTGLLHVSNLNALKKGMYILRYFNGSQAESIKFLKQ